MARDVRPFVGYSLLRCSFLHLFVIVGHSSESTLMLANFDTGSRRSRFIQSQRRNEVDLLIRPCCQPRRHAVRRCRPVELFNLTRLRMAYCLEPLCHYRPRQIVQSQEICSVCMVLPSRLLQRTTRPPLILPRILATHPRFVSCAFPTFPEASTDLCPRLAPHFPPNNYRNRKRDSPSP